MCAHPARDAIDRALVAGTPNLRIARRYSLTEQSLRRHKDTHLPKALVQAQKTVAIELATDLATETHRLAADARRIGQAAEAKGDLRTALAAVRELVRMIELMAKVQAVDAADRAGPSQTELEAHIDAAWEKAQELIRDNPRLYALTEADLVEISKGDDERRRFRHELIDTFGTDDLDVVRKRLGLPSASDVAEA